MSIMCHLRRREPGNEAMHRVHTCSTQLHSVWKIHVLAGIPVIAD